MTDISFQVERCADVLDEIKPLLAEHWQEIALYKDQFPLNPDYGKYQALDDAGLVHIATIRKGGALIGYCVSMVMRHLHYSDCVIAMNDILFLKKEYRNGRLGLKLIAFAEDELRKIGVHRMALHVKTAHNFGPMLVRMGFCETERVYEKLLNRGAV